MNPSLQYSHIVNHRNDLFPDRLRLAPIIEDAGPDLTLKTVRPAFDPLSSVLVAHPTLQHSHQLALALHERGSLQAFWSGVPVASPGERLPGWMPLKHRQKIKRVDIPAFLRVHPLRFQIALKTGEALLPEPIRDAFGDLPHRIFHWFDSWTARRIEKIRPRIVIAYENSAYRTFSAAKAVGARCVLDAASLHHKASSNLMHGNGSTFEREINRRKDAESLMADLILTCSPLAADSYVGNGIPAAKVRSLLLGAELPEFLPGRRISAGPVRFIFAGVLSRRKSVDLILEAFKRLAAEGLPYELQFVGNVADSSLLDHVRQIPGTSYRSGVAQHDLYPMLTDADCLLLPSRFDSFGMVVAEAMACGTPAIVSDQTGAKAIIESFPGSGWIVRPEIESIYAQIKILLTNPMQLEKARSRAQLAAQSYTWQAYRGRARDLLKDAMC